MTDLTRAAWRKARRSGGGNNCVEIASLQRVIALRDSKNPDKGAIVISPDQWRHLTARIKKDPHTP
jgi:hypothetical protein